MEYVLIGVSNSFAAVEALQPMTRFLPQGVDPLTFISLLISVIAIFVSFIAIRRSSIALRPGAKVNLIDRDIEKMKLKMRDHSGRFNSNQVQLAKEITDFRSKLNDLEQYLIDSATGGGDDEETNVGRHFD